MNHVPHVKLSTSLGPNPGLVGVPVWYQTGTYAQNFSNPVPRPSTLCPRARFS